MVAAQGFGGAINNRKQMISLSNNSSIVEKTCFPFSIYKTNLL